MRNTAHDRRKIFDRLAALEAMTEANGCTPAEAAVARSAAAKLRERFDITDADVGEDRERLRANEAQAFMLSRDYPSPDNSRHLHQLVSVAGVTVAAHFECRGFVAGNAFVIVGNEEKVHAAHAMLAHLCAECGRHFVSLKAFTALYTTDLHPRTISAEFRKGFGFRTFERIMALPEEEPEADPDAGQEIVLHTRADEGAAIDEAMKVFEPHLKPRSANFRNKTTWAFLCGWAAGERVRLFANDDSETASPDWLKVISGQGDDDDATASSEVSAMPETRNRPSRTRKRQRRRLWDDVVHSTGWGLYRMGRLLMLAGLIVAWAPPEALSGIGIAFPVHALPADRMHVFWIGFVMVLLGEGLGGKEFR